VELENKSMLALPVIFYNAIFTLYDKLMCAKYYGTISTKCTDHTYKLIQTLLRVDPFFVSLNKHLIDLSPSWLIKFSIAMLLKSLETNYNEIEPRIMKIVANAHKVEFLDHVITQHLDNIRE